MKKLVITKKKKISVFENKKKRQGMIVRAAAFLLSVSLFPGAVEVQAQETQSVSYIYHQHTGSSEKEGGCYKLPVYHVHAGDEAAGGSCYETVIYHVHAGDDVNGGDCYKTPVYHVHEGDGTAEEGCYKAQYHSHSSSCYKTVSHTEYGCYTVKTVDTSDGDYEGHDFKYYYMSCGRVIHGTNSSHTHSVLNCNKGNVIVGYVIDCGKTEETIECYLLDCEKTEETIEGYALSCPKTAETIDSYALSCGRDEQTPVGKITLIKEKIKNKNKVKITVSFEDMSEGELALSETPFAWYDESGNLIGTGESVEVSKNGTYGMHLSVLNEDVKADSLKAETVVDTIKKAADQDTGKDSGEDDSDQNTGSDSTEGDDNGSDQETEESTECTPSPSISPSPASTTEPSAQTVSTGDNTDKAKKDEDSKKSLSDNKDKSGVSKTPVPTMKKETETIKVEEKESEKKEVLPVEAVEIPEKTGFFGSLSEKTVKVIGITAGTFLLMTGLFVLLYLFRRSVRLYNDDGKGNMIYLGRCMIRSQEDGFVLSISDSMAEKAVTNRYCIKSELFHLFRSEEEELMVEKGTKRVSVPLRAEMVVVI